MSQSEHSMGSESKGTLKISEWFDFGSYKKIKTLISKNIKKFDDPDSEKPLNEAALVFF